MTRLPFPSLLVLCAFVGASFLQAEPRTDRHVIFISIDGLAHFYFDDPLAEMPTLRRLAAEGARAKAVTTTLPTVTWPNHTSLVTGVRAGRHGVIANNYFDRETQQSVDFIPDPHFDKDEIVKVPTIYDVAHDAGLKTAGIIWPASRNAKSLDWTVPDVFPQELWDRYSTPSLLEEARAKGIPVDKQGEWCKAGPFGYLLRDRLYTQLTRHLIETHQPNLLLLHLVAVDSLQHAHGSHTPEAYFAIKQADEHVRDLVEAVEKAGLKEKTTFVIMSDHGFINYTKTVQPNVMLKQEGLIKEFGGKPVERKVWSFAQGVAFIYLLDQTDRAALLADITPKLAALEGVSEVITEADFAKYGLQTVAEDPRMPDLILSAKEGYNFSNSVAGNDTVTTLETQKGAHGYSPSDPLMDASFLASGAGVKAGVTLDRIGNIDIAPTVAKLLGIEMKDVEGQVLDGILE